MLERDYLLRLLIEFTNAIRRSLERADAMHDPVGAAETLEDAIGNATEIDGATLLSLTPESMVSILEVSGTDPKVIGYVSRSLVLDAYYWREGGNVELASLREAQGQALAAAYGVDLGDNAHNGEFPTDLIDYPENEF